MDKPTKKELTNLFYKVENEGFGYYIFDYGPDLTLIARMGFDRERIRDAIKLLNDVKKAIYNIDLE